MSLKELSAKLLKCLGCASTNQNVPLGALTSMMRLLLGSTNESLELILWLEVLALATRDC